MRTDNIKRLLVSILVVLLLLCVCIGSDYAINNTTDNNDTITVTANQTQATVSENLTIINGTYYDLPEDAGWAKTDGKIYTVKKAVKKTYKKLPVITMTGKPSCYTCWKNHRPYKWYKRTYINYCPNCRRYGTLYNAHKRGSRYEQEISCRICDCDFCIYCGRDKVSGGGRYKWNILRRM